MIRAGPVESNKIRFVALIRGMPLKIAQAKNYPGDKPVGPQAIASVNAASVDSELAVLGLRSPTISGRGRESLFPRLSFRSRTPPARKSCSSAGWTRPRRRPCDG